MKKIKSILILSLILAGVGCKCIEKETLTNLNDTVMKEYKEYVEKDPNLSESGKKIRLIRVKTFDKLVKEYNE